ncbi:hypothetical protein [Brevibacterium sp. CS2]|uniref:hypothetical protein n=1 Tax=Brevibacterium sp. CS2 TaxID=2575923 RepID=UPI0010C7773D|nr:hypothetical protein [Brevibacterium sp. CS2]QCP05375.1 hypothetical protein FDF13_08855 [Brevibacterium sp. CS2]
MARLDGFRRVDPDRPRHRHRVGDGPSFDDDLGAQRSAAGFLSPAGGLPGGPECDPRQGDRDDEEDDEEAGGEDDAAEQLHG